VCRLLLVLGSVYVLSWCLCLTLGVYYILYIYYYYILLYITIIIYYYILYYTHLFLLFLPFISQSSSPSSSNIPSQSISQYSFYTCRYLDTLIYILPIFQDNLLIYHLIPNIHSILVGTWIHLFIFSSDLSRCFDPARSIGVDG
jgi:hypothetical protein